MSELLAHLPPTCLVPAGRYGRTEGPAGVRARLLPDGAAATLVARKGVRPHEPVARAFGLALPDGPTASFAVGITAIGTGPGRWLLLAETMTGDDLLACLADAVGDRAACTDQSDALLVFELGGPQVRAALATLAPLDLDPVSFSPGDAATTSMALVGVTLWQIDAAPVYGCAVGRSFAPAFLRALTAGAAPHGFKLEGTGRG